MAKIIPKLTSKQQLFVLLKVILKIKLYEMNAIQYLNSRSSIDQKLKKISKSSQIKK